MDTNFDKNETVFQYLERRNKERKDYRPCNVYGIPKTTNFCGKNDLILVIGVWKN